MVTESVVVAAAWIPCRPTGTRAAVGHFPGGVAMDTFASTDRAKSSGGSISSKVSPCGASSYEMIDDGIELTPKTTKSDFSINHKMKIIIYSYVAPEHKPPNRCKLIDHVRFIFAPKRNISIKLFFFLRWWEGILVRPRPLRPAPSLCLEALKQVTAADASCLTSAAHSLHYRHVSTASRKPNLILAAPGAPQPQK